MARQVLAPILVAALVVLAGCGGATLDSGTTPDGVDPTNTRSGGTATPAESDDSSDSAADGSDDSNADGSGSVRFYVSDERNAIGDFEHLNVTVSKIGLKPAVAEADGTTAENESTATPTPAATPTVTPVATPTDAHSSTSLMALAADDATATDVAAMTETERVEKGGWIEYDVDSRTYDLTELQGANASHLADVTVPQGTYEKVFVFVSSVEGTLDDGTTVTVKLPSEKLHLNKGFTVGDGQSVEFVYDVAVHGAGKSGKYILKPVVRQSGTSDEIDIESVDGDSADADDRGADGDDGATGGTALSASFAGDASPGDDAVVEAVLNGSALANATVEVDDAVVGETNETGRLTVTVPENAEEFEVRVSYDDEAVELSRTFGREGTDENRQGGQNDDRGRGNGKNE